MCILLHPTHPICLLLHPRPQCASYSTLHIQYVYYFTLDPNVHPTPPYTSNMSTTPPCYPCLLRTLPYPPNLYPTWYSLSFQSGPNLSCHFRPVLSIKDDRTGQNKHELLQYSVRTINNSKVSRITYPRKMHALYEKLV